MKENKTQGMKYILSRTRLSQPWGLHNLQISSHRFQCILLTIKEIWATFFLLKIQVPHDLTGQFLQIILELSWQVMGIIDCFGIQILTLSNIRIIG